MSDPGGQLEYACLHEFPDRPLSIADIEGYLSNAETLDYAMYSSPDGLQELIVVAGTRSYHLEYRMGTWLGPHNSSIRWKEHPDCETPTEVADEIARGGWSVLNLADDSTEGDDG